MVSRREGNHWKSFQLCWKLLLELFSRSSPFASRSGKSGQASPHCFCRKRRGKDQAARGCDLLKVPWAGSASSRTHLLNICLAYSFLCCFSFKELGCSLCPPSPDLKNTHISASWCFTIYKYSRLMWVAVILHRFLIPRLGWGFSWTTIGAKPDVTGAQV